ncbi:MAG: hypothetical protein FWD79_05345 [Desulfobulbus sp.]|nr:hypothetical protein [Desulfobulbus sp.]
MSEFGDTMVEMKNGRRFGVLRVPRGWQGQWSSSPGCKTHDPAEQTGNRELLRQQTAHHAPRLEAGQDDADQSVR